MLFVFAPQAKYIMHTAFKIREVCCFFFKFCLETRCISQVVVKLFELTLNQFPKASGES